MHLRACLITAFSITTYSAVAATDSPCPIISDFQCLVRHSIDVYDNDYEHWWSIYHAGFEKAWNCRSISDVTTLLTLWSGHTDGEMAESLTEDTSKLLISKPQCFFDGALLLRPTELTTLADRFCPWAEPKSAFVAVLREYANRPNYTHLAAPLLKRVENDECT